MRSPLHVDTVESHSRPSHDLRRACNFLACAQPDPATSSARSHHIERLTTTSLHRSPEDQANFVPICVVCRPARATRLDAEKRKKKKKQALEYGGSYIAIDVVGLVTERRVERVRIGNMSRYLLDPELQRRCLILQARSDAACKFVSVIWSLTLSSIFFSFSTYHGCS